MPFDLDAPWWHKLLDVVMYPASMLVSITVFARRLRRPRGGGARRSPRWRGGALWFVANALEVLVKVAIEKPELYRVEERRQPTTSRASTTRSRAATRCGPSWSRCWSPTSGGGSAAWRRRGLLLVPFCLVAASWHVPSDVVGGLVFGLLAVARHVRGDRRRDGAPVVADGRRRRRRAARAGRGRGARRSAAGAGLRRRAAGRAARGGAEPGAAPLAARARRGRRPASRARRRRGRP